MAWSTGRPFALNAPGLTAIAARLPPAELAARLARLAAAAASAADPAANAAAAARSAADAAALAADPAAPPTSVTFSPNRPNSRAVSLMSWGGHQAALCRNAAAAASFTSIVISADALPLIPASPLPLLRL